MALRFKVDLFCTERNELGKFLCSSCDHFGPQMLQCTNCTRYYCGECKPKSSSLANFNTKTKAESEQQIKSESRLHPCECASDDLALVEIAEIWPKLHSLEIKCVHHDRGCTQVMHFSSFQKHVEQCQFSQNNLLQNESTEVLKKSKKQLQKIEALFQKEKCQNCGKLILAQESEKHKIDCSRDTNRFKKARLAPKVKMLESSRERPCKTCGNTMAHSETVCALTVLENFQSNSFLLIRKLEKSVVGLKHKLRNFTKEKILICNVCRNFGCESTLERCSQCKSYICQSCKKFSTKPCNQCKQIFCVLCFYISGEKNYFDSARSTKIELKSRITKNNRHGHARGSGGNRNAQATKQLTNRASFKGLHSIVEENEDTDLWQTPIKTYCRRNETSIGRTYSKWSNKAERKSSGPLSHQKLSSRGKNKNELDSGYDFFIGVQNFKIYAGRNEEKDDSKNMVEKYGLFHHKNDSNRECSHKLGMKDIEDFPLSKKHLSRKSELVCISSRSGSKFNYFANEESRQKILYFKNENKSNFKSLNYSVPYKEMVEGVQFEDSEGITGNKHYFNKIDITENLDEKNQVNNLLSKNVCFMCNTKNKNKRQNKYTAKRTPVLINSLAKVISKMKTTFD